MEEQTKQGDRAQKIEGYSQDIKDAKATLSKYKTMLKEVTSATKTLIVASAKRGLTSQIDKIQRAYEEKKQALTDRIAEGKEAVKRSETAQKSSIKRTKTNMERYDSNLVQNSEEHGGFRAHVARRIRGIDKRQTARYTVSATIGGKTLTTLAKAAASVGMKKTATRIGVAGANYVNNKMDTASKKATARRTDFRARTTAYDRASKGADKVQAATDKAYSAEDKKSKEWREQEGPGKITRRTISGIAKGVSAMAKFTSKTRTGLYEMAAHTAAALGNAGRSKKLMERAEEKAKRTMGRAQAFNEGMRTGADAGIEAGEKVSEGVKAFGRGAKAIGKSTIDFTVGAVVIAGQQVTDKAMTTRDNVSLRYQKSKQGLLGLIRRGAQSIVGRMDESLEVSRAAASKTQERIDERKGSKKQEEAGQEK